MKELLLIAGMALPVLKIVFYVAGIYFIILLIVYWFDLDDKMVEGNVKMMRKMSKKKIKKIIKVIYEY